MILWAVLMVLLMRFMTFPQKIIYIFTVIIMIGGLLKNDIEMLIYYLFNIDYAVGQRWREVTGEDSRGLAAFVSHAGGTSGHPRGVMPPLKPQMG